MTASRSRSVVVYADGGSRGNPGPAGFGSVVLAADGRTVLAERAVSIGRATNNVAEYSGLIAGLEAARDLGATAVAVRMDSKLVVEQMSGRWQVKHPDMKPLAAKASALMRGFDSVSFQWIPRAQNSHADRLANLAMDAAADGAAVITEVVNTPIGLWEVAESSDGDPTSEFGSDARPSTAVSSPASGPASARDVPVADPAAPVPASASAWTPARASGPAPREDPAAGLPVPLANGATRLIVVRHGETTWGALGRFAGRQDVPLTENGEVQAASVASRIQPLQPAIVLTSPLTRCRMTAQAIASACAVSVLEHEGLIDGKLGDWTGLRSDEIEQRWPAVFARWRSDVDAQPPGGESFTEIRGRVSPVIDEVVDSYRGHTVVLVTHAATTKMILAQALGVGSEVAYRLRVDTASMSGFTISDDGLVVLWAMNETGHLPG